MTTKELEEKDNGLAYRYVRGSTLYGTTVEGSDIDYGGVYIAPINMILGLRENYEQQVSDEKNDVTYYELGRWVELLCNGNPNALESLFAPKDKVVGKIHPAVQIIIDNRNVFLSKQCFNSLNGYAYAQIQKARGLNKKIVNPITERKDVLDFCYTFKGQGSEPVKKWLERHGLKQRYCGIVNIPNMREAYSVFYDFGNHILNEGITKDDFIKANGRNDKRDTDNNKKEMTELERFVDFAMNNEFPFVFAENCYDSLNKPIGYRGIISEDGDSNDVRCSSVLKGAVPIFHMCYNRDAYTSHCKDYKEYKEWEEKRNPVRYQSNLNKNYDSKNMSHCIRLLHMGKELAEGKGLNVVRTWDRQFLIDIRNHKYEYDYLIKYAEGIKEEMNELIAKCTLPDTVDRDKVNRLLLRARTMAYFQQNNGK